MNIRHQILTGFTGLLLLSLGSIYLVVESRVKPELISERKAQIANTQSSLDKLLSAHFEKVQLLTSSLALAYSKLPKDEALFKQVFPDIIDNHGDRAIAGGGIWPEPGMFESGTDRRSFFWGRTDSGIQYFDDYNDPSGSGYHNEGWYQVGRTASASRCAWSEAYIDPFTKTPMVTCTIPMKDKGRFAGVATVDMMLDGVTALLNQYAAENGGYIFAVDASGQMLSFPEGQATLVKADDSMMTASELASRLQWLAPVLNQASSLRGSAGFDVNNDPILGDDSYVSLIRQKDTGWVIGLVVPEKVMTGIASNMGLFLMLTIGGLLIIVSVIAVIFANGLLSKITQTKDQIMAMTSGDSTGELDTGAMNEIGELRAAVNAYGRKLKELLNQIRQESAHLVQDASTLKQFSNEFMSKANSLSDENHTLAAATEELGATSQDVALHAGETRGTVERIHQDILDSGQEMQNVISTMRSLSEAMTQAQKSSLKLDEDSRKANGMLSAIRDIAEQTNLLALNAAIEAARAGESGRGFAVVADEVRNLAAKSESSAVEIEAILGRLQVASRESVSSMELGQSETGKAVDIAESTAAHLQDVVNTFQQINDQASQISVAAQEQQKVSGDLSRFVARLQDLTGSNADDSGRLSHMSDEIDAIARRLNDIR